MTHASEIAGGERFGFGANWQAFINRLDSDRVAEAEASLKSMLGITSLAGLRFLDVGSGSGLFSLAAYRLGAEVYSFDYDPNSVACTKLLRDQQCESTRRWTVEEGSVLNGDYLERMGRFDIVYSWGVLHHTGSMWQAIENATRLVAPDGRLFIAIYNDQGRASKRWLRVKQAYNHLSPSLRWLVLWPVFLRLWGPTTLRDLLSGKPGRTWREFKRQRGMDPWRDVVDWVGGYPFEVATPEAIFDFCRDRGFRLDRLKTCAGGLGCNEFVLTRVTET